MEWVTVFGVAYHVKRVLTLRMLQDGAIEAVVSRLGSLLVLVVHKGEEGYQALMNLHIERLRAEITELLVAGGVL